MGFALPVTAPNSDVSHFVLEHNSISEQWGEKSNQRRWAEMLNSTVFSPWDKLLRSRFSIKRLNQQFEAIFVYLKTDYINGNNKKQQ